MPVSRQKVAHADKTIQLQIQIDIYKDGESFVAFSPALDLSSYAKSEVLALKRFKEALDLFIEDTVSKGTLERILLDLGWKLQRKPIAKYQPPARKAVKRNLHMIESIQQQIAIPV